MLSATRRRHYRSAAQALKTVWTAKDFYSVPRTTDEDMLDGQQLFVDADPQHSIQLL